MALKFAGRTPSAALRRPHRVLSREQASRRSRLWATRCAAAFLLLFLLTTLWHAFIDNAANRSALSSTRSALAWNDVAQAPLLFVGEILRQSQERGAAILLGAVVVASVLWLLGSLLGEWRRPPTGFLALLAVQFFRMGVSRRQYARDFAHRVLERRGGSAAFFVEQFVDVAANECRLERASGNCDFVVVGCGNSGATAKLERAAKSAGISEAAPHLLSTQRRLADVFCVCRDAFAGSSSFWQNVELCDAVFGVVTSNFVADTAVRVFAVHRARRDLPARPRFVAAPGVGAWSKR